MIINEVTGQELFEMPKMIEDEDFGLDSDMLNKEMAHIFLNGSNTKKIDVINGFNLYKQENKFALIDEGHAHIMYYMKYEVNRVNLLNCDAAQQIAVWKEHGILTSGIASKMFFDYLLPMVGCIITDLYQTTYGMRFWLDRVADAFPRNLKVLYVDTKNKSVITVKDMVHLKSLKSDIWGTGEDYQSRRVVIMK